MRGNDVELTDEKEFILYFSSIVIKNDYNVYYISYVMEALRKFCNADYVLWHFNGHGHNVDKQKAGQEDIYVSVADGTCQILLKNVKREFEHYEFFWSIVKTSLVNMVKTYHVVDKLNKEKNTDKMLNVYNRNAFEDFIKTNNKFNNVGIVFLDVNGLGVINNKYGHEQGDYLLMSIVSCLVNDKKSKYYVENTKAFRNDDIYRIGGDEFIIICDNISEEMFNAKLDDALKRIENSPYTVSTGVVYKHDLQDLENAIKIAGIKMKKNKAIFRKEHPEKYENKYTVQCMEEEIDEGLKR